MTEERKRITGEIKCRELSRRDFIKTAGVGLAATGLGAGIIIPARARASKKQLRIVQWQHKDPTFDDWFKLYAKNWGEKNNTEVKVENHR
jgi:anaerobic selenocysteine-containing dehydrogenase